MIDRPGLQEGQAAVFAYQIYFLAVPCIGRYATLFGFVRLHIHCPYFIVGVIDNGQECYYFQHDIERWNHENRNP